MNPDFSKIMVNNARKIVDDIEEAVTIMVFASSTGLFFEITKKELYDHAEHDKIRYIMTHRIFNDERLTFVVL